jgi:dUTP pyrophosphatase
MIVKIKKLHPNAIVPKYAKAGDAAMDLIATSMEVDGYGNLVYKTGLALEIPKGFVGLLFPRSSVSKTSMSLANSVGVIDSGYRGEIMLKYKDVGKSSSIQVLYKAGDRVGQLMVIPYPEVEFIEADELSITDRGSGGFGSTGS